MEFTPNQFKSELDRAPISQRQKILNYIKLDLPKPLEYYVKLAAVAFAAHEFLSIIRSLFYDVLFVLLWPLHILQYLISFVV